MTSSNAFSIRFIFLAAALITAIFSPIGFSETETESEFKFTNQYGDPMFFPDYLSVYTAESPGPWKGLEAAHEPLIKSRMLKEGLESTRILTVRLSHGDAEGQIRAYYIKDKDGIPLACYKFKDSDQNPVLVSEVKFTAVINYIEIYVECSQHGLWKKAYRFV